MSKFEKLYKSILNEEKTPWHGRYTAPAYTPKLTARDIEDYAQFMLKLIKNPKDPSRPVLKKVIAEIYKTGTISKSAARDIEQHPWLYLKDYEKYMEDGVSEISIDKHIIELDNVNAGVMQARRDAARPESAAERRAGEDEMRRFDQASAAAHRE
jgi:hypothetical protein